ncbi:hypothetical protein BU064_10820 [Staphylococcus succinus]|nr:hypothetical protein BU064_10820 [Staphylococcus succinus]
MKKVLFLVLASFLALAACGNSEESKSEDKKETKSSSKDDKKKDENKKSNDDKKEKSDKEDNDKKETSNTDNNQQEDTQQANTEQQTQPVEQQQTTQEPVQSQEQPVAQNQQGLSEAEIQNEINEKANTEEGAEVIRRLGEQGIKVGSPGQAIGTDAQGTEEMDAFAQEQIKDTSSGPRSLREIKEDTGKGASEFTQSEINEANAYANEH